MAIPTDLDIARTALLKPLDDIACEIGIGSHLLEPHGEHVMKIKLAAIDELASAPRAKYVVVTAITPTPLGEGKTTTTVGLGQGFKHIGRRATVAIRQPSMGPTFGIKGGAAGGGYSQVVPMEVLNLHLTGDMHAVTAAHNMLAAMIDNHLYQGNALGIDPNEITWRRVLDVNDRALRNIVIGLGPRADGVTRQTGFDITAASEVMATLALASSLDDLRQRLGRIVVGYTSAGSPVTACMSPVRCRFSTSIGTTWLYPPPAAPPLIPKVGPIEGCRIATVARLPMCLNPCPRPTVVVVLPSPSGVGVIAVTTTYFALGALASSPMAASLIFMTCSPRGSSR